MHSFTTALLNAASCFIACWNMYFNQVKYFIHLAFTYLFFYRRTTLEDMIIALGENILGKQQTIIF